MSDILNFHISLFMLYTFVYIIGIFCNSSFKFGFIVSISQICILITNDNEYHRYDWKTDVIFIGLNQISKNRIGNVSLGSKG
jgi:hypothetical protein